MSTALEEAMSTLAAVDAERDAAEQLRRAACTRHVRMAASATGARRRNPLARGAHPWAGRPHVKDQGPGRQAQTLCGGPPTTEDMSWREGRSKAGRAYVTCSGCLVALDGGAR